MDNYNGFPATYKPVYYPTWQYIPTYTTATPYERATPQTQTTTLPPYQPRNAQPVGGSMIWVQGEVGAKAFSNLQPGVPVALWDSEEPVIYIKTIDETGKPSTTILDYTERKSEEEKDALVEEYITKDQFDVLSGQLQSLGDQLKDIKSKMSENTQTQKQQQNNNQNNRKGNR